VIEPSCIEIETVDTGDTGAESRGVPPELTTALEQFREDLRQEIRTSAAETRAYVDAGVAEIRADAASSAAETRAYVDASAAETRAYVDNSAAQTRRELGVLIEDLGGTIQVVAEGVVGLNQKFDAFIGDQDRLRRRVDLVEDRVTVLEQGARRPRRKR
jgi:hypothetical protein